MQTTARPLPNVSESQTYNCAPSSAPGAGISRFALFSAVFASTTLGMAGIASAGGFATARFGGEHAHPAADHPTAIYYNPAGLALGKGTRIFAEGVFAYRDVSYDRPVGAINNVTDTGVGTPTEAVGANSGSAGAKNIIASPFLGVVSDLGVKNLGVGLAAYAPFGGQAEWDTNDAFKDSDAYPGAVDGVQRWSTMSGSLRALYFSLGAAYYLPGPRLSFGASVSLISESLDTIRARNAVGTDDLVSGSGNLLEGRSHLDVSGLSYGAGFGVIWEAIDDLHIGLSYQSQPGFGKTTQSGDLNFKFGNSASDTSKVDFTQKLPDIVRLGGSYRVQKNLELRLFGDYTRWSVFDNQCITDANDPGANCSLDAKGGATADTQGVVANLKRDWKDTFGVRVGATYWLDEDKELTGSLAYDSSAVPDKTIDPALIDMDKMGIALGGRIRLTDEMRLNLSYSQIFYFKRDIDVRERDSMGTEIGFPSPSAVPDHAGVYKQWIGLINLGLEYAF